MTYGGIYIGRYRWWAKPEGTGVFAITRRRRQLVGRGWYIGTARDVLNDRTTLIMDVAENFTYAGQLSWITHATLRFLCWTPWFGPDGSWVLFDRIVRWDLGDELWRRCVAMAEIMNGPEFDDREEVAS